MGFRFRKSIKILPGVKLNLTHKGISSASIGKAGANINIGKKGTRTTVGLPGSGLSYSKYQAYDEKNPQQQATPTQAEVDVGFPPPIPPQPKRSMGIGTIVVCVLIAFFLGAIVF